MDVVNDKNIYDSNYDTFCQSDLDGQAGLSPAIHPLDSFTTDTPIWENPEENQQENQNFDALLSSEEYSSPFELTVEDPCPSLPLFCFTNSENLSDAMPEESIFDKSETLYDDRPTTKVRRSRARSAGMAPPSKFFTDLQNSSLSRKIKKKDNSKKSKGSKEYRPCPIQRLSVKVLRVYQYWNKQSLFQPNVLRLLSPYDSETEYLEFQDFSFKEVLAEDITE